MGADINVPDSALHFAELALQFRNPSGAGALLVEGAGLGPRLFEHCIEVRDTGRRGEQQPAYIASSIRDILATLFDGGVVET